MFRGYILRGKKVIPVNDILLWTNWFETTMKRVVKQEIIDKNGLLVLTVFLGIDHSFSMVFSNEKLSELVAMERYTTYEEAESGGES